MQINANRHRIKVDQTKKERRQNEAAEVTLKFGQQKAHYSLFRS